MVFFSLVCRLLEISFCNPMMISKWCVVNDAGRTEVGKKMRIHDLVLKRIFFIIVDLFKTFHHCSLFLYPNEFAFVISKVDNRDPGRTDPDLKSAIADQFLGYFLFFYIKFTTLLIDYGD